MAQPPHPLLGLVVVTPKPAGQSQSAVWRVPSSNLIADPLWIAREARLGPVRQSSENGSCNLRSK